MKPEIKKRWIEALLSGKYEQGKDCLRTQDDKYCCLGVLCDLYVKEGHSQWTMNVYGAWELHARTGLLPSKVAEWAGIDSQYGWANDQTSLTTMNDNGSTFKEIAAKIEEVL